MINIDFHELKSFSYLLLKKVGLDEFSARSVSDGLCETSLRGIDSHGIRLFPHYVNSAQTGRKNPQPNFQYTQSFPSIIALDADNAFGHAAGMKAIELGIGMAKTQGMGAVSVANSSHCGAMACFALEAARQGYIAFAFTHADALLQSTNGNRPYFGTNPVCMAAPRKGMEAYCLDMATSIIPWNRVLMNKANGDVLPEGMAANSNGEPTTDPNDAAWLMPVGGYKGYGLASMVEILCGVMSGMAWGRSIPVMYKHPMEETRNLGQFYMVMRTDGVIDAETFAQQMTEMSREVAEEPVDDGGASVMLPGDREVMTAEKRMQKGIPLDEDTAEALVALSEKHELELVLK